MRGAWIVGPFLLVAGAHAEERSFHATLSGDVAATDNVFSASSDGGNREPDVYAQLRPGLLFGYATPRSTYEAHAEAEALDYARHSDNPSLTFSVKTHAAWVLSPESEFTLGANGQTGKLNSLASRTTPDQTVVTVAPIGETTVLQGDANQGFGTALGRTYHLSQGLGARWVQTKEEVTQAENKSGDASVTLALDKAADTDSVGIATSFGVSRLLRYVPPSMTVAASGRLDRSLSPQAGMFWRHDVSRTWSTYVSGGLAWVIPFGTDPYNEDVKRSTTVSPVLSGSLSYTDRWGFANLSASRVLQPNLLIAQNTINNGAALTASVPLVWLEDNLARQPRFIASASAGFMQTELVESTSAEPQGTFYVTHFDAGVAYTPRINTTFSLRYALTHQTGDASATMVIPTFTTNTLTLNFTLRYPETNPVVGKKKSSVRADRSDVTEEPSGDADAGIGGNVTPAE